MPSFTIPALVSIFSEFLVENHHHSAIEVFDGIDQSIDRLHVQMVRGFVQVNQVRPQVKVPKQSEATSGVRSFALKTLLAAARLAIGDNSQSDAALLPTRQSLDSSEGHVTLA